MFQSLIIHIVATDVASKGLDFPDIQHVFIKIKIFLILINN